MAKIHARNASIYVDDTSSACTSVSGDTNQISLSFTSDAPEVTGFGDIARQRLSNGLTDWELTLNGYVNTPDSSACVLHALNGGSTFIQFGPAGSAADGQKFTACAVCTDFTQDYGVEDAATFSATFSNRSGSLSASTW